MCVVLTVHQNGFWQGSFHAVSQCSVAMNPAGINPPIAFSLKCGHPLKLRFGFLPALVALWSTTTCSLQQESAVGYF